MFGRNNTQAQTSSAVRRLMKEYMDLTADPINDMLTAGPVSEDNMLEWEALIQGPEGTPYEGGIFAAKLLFPSDYPHYPFKMVFDPPLLHPNIYPNGTVCISILHPPGDDPLRYESASERWSPIQGVRSVLLSVLSMLAEPNIESGADVECCKLYRDNRAEFERRVRAQVRGLLGIDEDEEAGAEAGGAAAGETSGASASASASATAEASASASAAPAS